MWIKISLRDFQKLLRSHNTIGHYEAENRYNKTDKKCNITSPAPTPPAPKPQWWGKRMPQVVINPGKRWMKHAFSAAVGCLKKRLLSCLTWSADRTGIVWMSGITENRGWEKWFAVTSMAWHSLKRCATWGSSSNGGRGVEFHPVSWCFWKATQRTGNCLTWFRSLKGSLQILDATEKGRVEELASVEPQNFQCANR